MRRLVRLSGAGTAIAIAVVAALATAAFATSDASARRLAGANRYGTAAAIATATTSSAAVVVLASGEDFPDALAAAYLAGRVSGPVLLTPRTALAADTAAAIESLGASGVQVVGGPAAVDEAVVADLRARGLTVERVAGPDRFATAAAVARLFPATFVGSLPGGAGPTAIVASGLGFADALAGAPLAAQASFPILLTAPGALPGAASDALDALGIRQVLLLGGPQAVSPAVEAAISAKGIAVRRIGGADRQETARLVADLAVDTLGWPGTHANVARGDHFADALAGGWHAGVERGPILLTASPAALGPHADAWLRSRSATVATIDVLGGTVAVSDAVVDAAVAAARNA